MTDYPITHPETYTDGLSPKAVLAFLMPLVVTLSATLVSWIVTGSFNEAEFRTAIGGAVASVLAGVGAYTAHPGTVQVTHVTPSDSLLPDDFEQRATQTSPPA